MAYASVPPAGTVPPGQPYDMYRVDVLTGDQRRGGTTGRVFLKLYGSHGESDLTPLVAQEAKDNAKLFKRGKVDSFYIACPNVGIIHKVLVFMKGRTHTWFLEEVLIRVSARVYRASFQRWMRGEVVQSVELIEDTGVKYAGGRIILGPILRLRGLDGNRWRMSAMVVTEDIPMMR